MRRERRTYVKDPMVKRPFGKGGRPPSNHARQCQGTKRTGIKGERQCGKWARKGRDYCEFCGGNVPLGKKRMTKHSWYAASAGPTLKGQLEALAKLAPDERHSLEQEIDVSRLLATRSLKIFEAACIDPATSAKTSDDLKARAVVSVKEAIDSVGEMVSKAARVRALNHEIARIEGIDYIVTTIGSLLHGELSPYLDPVVLEHVMNRVKEKFANMPIPPSSGGVRLTIT